MVDQVTPKPSQPLAPTVRSRWSKRRIAVLAATVAVAALLVLGVRWWTHPTLFDSLGDSVTLKPRPVARAAVSTTVVFPRTEGESIEKVTLNDLDAVFRTNTAKAQVSYAICRMSAGEDPVLAVGNAGRFCSNLEPFESGARLNLGVDPDSDYLLATVTPTRPGVAHLTQVRLTYALDRSHLWQRGTQTVRVDRKVTAR